MARDRPEDSARHPDRAGIGARAFPTLPATFAKAPLWAEHKRSNQRQREAPKVPQTLQALAQRLKIRGSIVRLCELQLPFSLQPAQPAFPTIAAPTTAASTSNLPSRAELQVPVLMQAPGRSSVPVRLAPAIHRRVRPTGLVSLPAEWAHRSGEADRATGTQRTAMLTSRPRRSRAAQEKPGRQNPDALSRGWK